jgi:hypothetical protein
MYSVLGAVVAGGGAWLVTGVACGRVTLEIPALAQENLFL